MGLLLNILSLPSLEHVLFPNQPMQHQLLSSGTQDGPPILSNTTSRELLPVQETYPYNPPALFETAPVVPDRTKMMETTNLRMRLYTESRDDILVPPASHSAKGVGASSRLLHRRLYRL